MRYGQLRGRGLGARKQSGVCQGAHVQPLEGRVLLSAAWADGKDNAIAYDPAADRTWVAYYDAVDKDLKVTWKTGSGAFAAPQTIANNAPGGADNEYGSFVTMALDNNGLPGVAYYDAYNADLKFAKYNPTAGQFDGAVTVDAYRSTGMYPSLAFTPGSSGNAAISYYSGTGKALRFARLAGSTNTWAVDANPVDYATGEDIGRYSSLKYNPANGRWAVAYERTGTTTAPAVNGQIRYTQEISGGGWATPTYVYEASLNGGVSAGYTSLAFDTSVSPAVPAVTFYSIATTSLYFGRRQASGAWAPTSITKNTLSIGMYNTLWFKGGKAQITAFNRDGNSLLKYDEAAGWNKDPLFQGAGREAHAVELPSGQILFSTVAVVSNPGATNYTLQLRSSADANLGATYTRANTDTSNTFSNRAKFGAATFLGKMWVFGGVTAAGGDLADMYYSTDGNVWTPVTLTGDAISARSGLGMVVSGSNMYIVGGSGNNDVYVSSDGVNWTEQTTTAPFTAGLTNFATTAFDGDLYVIGGETSAGLSNAVWRSDDGGATWTSLTQASPFTARRGLAAASFNGELWVAGGVTSAFNNAPSADVWHSRDGSTWYLAPQDKWSARTELSLTVYDNRLWAVGGVAWGVRKNDVYSSLDGLSWTQTAASAPFPARSAHGALEFNGKLWILGGYDGSPTAQDVWYSN